MVTDVEDFLYPPCPDCGMQRRNTPNGWIHRQSGNTDCGDET